MSAFESLTRRAVGLAALFAMVVAHRASAQAPAPTRTGAPVASPPSTPVALTVNGKRTALSVDTRTTVLDLLRERIGLTGTKKGCDHGQCGACTVLVNGVRKNACLLLAASADGDDIVTIEGLAKGEELHPMQQAFLEKDGFQCGYCTPGQICSAVGMLDEVKRGIPSAAAADVRAAPTLNAAEIRERMSGNICRCSAYPNIVAAIEAAGGRA